MRNIRRAFLTLMLVAAAAAIVWSPSASSADKATVRWKVVDRCANGALVAPGRGVFNVRYQMRDDDVTRVEVTGCGANGNYRNMFELGPDAAFVQVYGLPFFKKGRLDILIEDGADDHVDYRLYAGDGSRQATFAFRAVGAAFFADTDKDGRWEIQILNVTDFVCANGVMWGADLEARYGSKLFPDSVCRKE